MEQGQNKEPEHEGEHYLRLLGLEGLADRDIVTDGGTIQARDFLDVCGAHARPMLIGFEAMSPNDPRYEQTKQALCGLINRYVEGNSA